MPRAPIEVVQCGILCRNPAATMQCRGAGTDAARSGTVLLPRLEDGAAIFQKRFRGRVSCDQAITTGLNGAEVCRL
jgi:hypothetical protein